MAPCRPPPSGGDVCSCCAPCCALPLAKLGGCTHQRALPPHLMPPTAPQVRQELEVAQQAAKECQERSLNSDSTLAELQQKVGLGWDPVPADALAAGCCCTGAGQFICWGSLPAAPL